MKWLLALLLAGCSTAPALTNCNVIRFESFGRYSQICEQRSANSCRKVAIVTYKYSGFTEEELLDEPCR